MHRAGLPLSVGQASLPLRLLIAIVFLVTAALCLGGGLAIARIGLGPRAVAVALIVPLGLIGLVAAAFVVAPHSRFGTWLDLFVPRLRAPRVAIVTAMTLWLAALLATMIR